MTQMITADDVDTLFPACFTSTFIPHPFCLPSTFPSNLINIKKFLKNIRKYNILVFLGLIPNWVFVCLLKGNVISALPLFVYPLYLSIHNSFYYHESRFCLFFTITSSGPQLIMSMPTRTKSSPWKYCMKCGSTLEDKLDVEQRIRRACSNDSCAWIFYDNPVPVVAGVVEHFNTREEAQDGKSEPHVILVQGRGWPSRL